MAVNLMKLMEEWFQMARQALQNEKTKVYDKAREDYLLSTNVKELMDKKDKLQDEKDILSDKISEIDKEISNRDPYASNNEIEAAWLSKYSSYKVSQTKAEVAVRSSKAKKNLDAFGSITNKFTQRMALAIWVKEQRAVLSQFYALDWSQLWIELPIDVNIWDIIIENGEIIIWDKVLQEKN